MDQLDAAAAKSAKREKIGHQGTFNANPLCCGSRRRHALHRGERRMRARRPSARRAKIRDGMRRILVDEQIPWGVYGESLVLPDLPEPQPSCRSTRPTFDASKLGFKGLKGARNPDLAYRLRVALLANGVDIMGAPGGLVFGDARPARGCPHARSLPHRRALV